MLTVTAHAHQRTMPSTVGAANDLLCYSTRRGVGGRAEKEKHDLLQSLRSNTAITVLHINKQTLQNV